AGPVLAQFLIFGALLALGGFIINGLVGVLAGGAGRRLARGSRIIDWLSGSIFAGLAVRLAIMERA
ncbi:MAG: LysE family translocator, partial [Pseudomonadota bacterium]